MSQNNHNNSLNQYRILPNNTRSGGGGDWCNLVIPKDILGDYLRTINVFQRTFGVSQRKANRSKNRKKTR